MGAAGSVEVTGEIDKLKTEGKSAEEIYAALDAGGKLTGELAGKTVAELEALLAAGGAGGSAAGEDGPPKIELPEGGSYKSADEIVAACVAAGVTGTVNLGQNTADEDMPEGLLRTCGIPVLSAIPAQLFAACTTTVTKLILKGNGLSFLPPEIAALGALECLDVSENAIEELPPLPPSLTELNISENKIGALPAHLGTLTALETLVAFKNAINSVPAEIANCTALTEVNLFNNKLIKLPKEMGACTKLEMLNVGGNKLKTLPPTDGWTAMKEIKCHQNGLFMVPSFAMMAELEIIKMDFNKALENLPELGEHSKLEQFEVGNCNLTALPPSMTTWTSLKLLNCGANKIAALPPLALPALEILNAGGNMLTELPAELAGCSSLKTLFFQENHITAVPAELAGLNKTLSRLNCAGQKTPGLAMDATLETLKSSCNEKKGRFIGL